MEPIKRRPHGAAHSTTAEEAVYALYKHLLPEERHEFARQIFQELSLDGLDYAHLNGERRRLAFRCLAEFAALDTDKLSHDEYVRIRKEHPEYNWLSPGQIVRALGVSGWTKAMQEARLGEAVEPDRLAREIGREFSEREALDALIECWKDLGRVPSKREYLAWAHRADMRARRGRRPLSPVPFVRMFGGFGDALVAAKIINPGDDAELVAYIQKGPRGLTEEETLKSIRFVVERLIPRYGRTPYAKEYTAEKYAINRAHEQTPVRIVSVGPIFKHFRDWNNAMKVAGYDPPPLSGWRERRPYEFRSEAHRTWTPLLCERALLDALAEFGPTLGPERYTAYRVYEIKRDPKRAYALPTAETIFRVLGDWRANVKRLLEKDS